MISNVVSWVTGELVQVSQHIRLRLNTFLCIALRDASYWGLHLDFYTFVLINYLFRYFYDSGFQESTLSILIATISSLNMIKMKVDVQRCYSSLA